MRKYFTNPTVVFAVYGVLLVAAVTGLAAIKGVATVTTADEVIFTFPLSLSLGYGAIALVSTLVVPWLIRNDPAIPGLPMIGRYLLMIMLAAWGMTLMMAGSSFRVGKQDFKYFNPISAMFGLKHEFNYAQLQTISVVHSGKRSELVMRMKGQPDTERFTTDALVLAGLEELKKQAGAQGVACTF